MNALSIQAKANPRLRQVFDLRSIPEDSSQRILKTVEHGTVLPIYRQRESKETIVVLRDKVVLHYYDVNGSKTASYVSAPKPHQSL